MSGYRPIPTNQHPVPPYSCVSGWQEYTNESLIQLQVQHEELFANLAACLRGELTLEQSHKLVQQAIAVNVAMLELIGIAHTYHQANINGFVERLSIQKGKEKDG